MAKSKKKGLKDYTLITLDENKVFQQRNEMLIQRVGKSSHLIEDAESAVEERNKVKRDLVEWETFLACDSIPKPFEPQKIRKFFFHTSRIEDQDVELNVDWTLGVDERSVLNQDIDSVDLTKKHLRLNKPNFGLQYDTRVNEAMIIARRIEDFLEFPTILLSKQKMQEIAEVKFLAFSHIHEYIDNLTYRVLCSEIANMDSVDSISAQYSHQAKYFNIHLWTFKNVPIYLNPIDTPTKTIALTRVGVKLVLPFSVICPNMVIRGLHCRFDHFSTHARFFDLPHVDEVETNIQICLKNEWNTEMEIQAKVKAKLIKQRADYDEALRLMAEEEEKAKSVRGAKSEDKEKPVVKKDKLKKPIKEPLIVTPELVPEVRPDFLNHDFLEFKNVMLQFHPERFGLTRGEINLRKYQILGGVYQINCLSKPTVVMLPKLIMGWYVADQGVGYKDLHAHFDTSRSQTDVAKFFQITFELPECYCLWGQPIPCFFEEGESYRNANLLREESVKGLLDISPVIINDFNLHELFTKRLMYDFIENSIPRFISSFKFPEDLFDEEEDKKSKVTLGRAKLTPEEQEREKELARQKQMLSYEVQHSPERLFPLFKKSLPVVILPREDLRASAATHAYEQFSDFMAALSSIEKSYRESKFKDRQGNPIKILAEKYDSNIRRPRIDSKTVLYTERASNMEFQPSQRSSSIRSGSKISLTASQARTSKSTLSDQGEKVAAKKKKSSKKKKPHKSFISNQEESEEGLTTSYSKWSTANIIKSEVNTATRKVTIWTDRLGTFGFAFYRYEHFPFKSWAIQPGEKNRNEVELKIESEYAAFRINVSADGYRVAVTDFTKYIKSRKVFLEIKEPITDIKILKEQFHEKYLNIFPERDAIWYMNGYFSEKHLAAEYHTYSCISLFATSLNFRHSIWNKLSNRRTMVLRFGELRDLDEDFFVLCIRPEEVKFVEIKELCTTLDIIELEYKPTWRNLEWYPDLNHLITSSYVNWSEMRTKDPNVVYYLKNILQAIRPLSCS